MDKKTVEAFLLSLPNTRLDYPFGEDVAVYKVFIPENPVAAQIDAMQENGKQSSEAYIATVNESVQHADKAARNEFPQVSSSADELAGAVRGEWKMFALMPEKSDPVRLSLKCDPQLAVLLREKYVTVMEGYHLNKKHWNTIVLSGELPWEEIQGLIVHSYNLVIGNKDHVPQTSK